MSNKITLTTWVQSINFLVERIIYGIFEYEHITSLNLDNTIKSKKIASMTFSSIALMCGYGLIQSQEIQNYFDE